MTNEEIKLVITHPFLASAVNEAKKDALYQTNFYCRMEGWCEDAKFNDHYQGRTDAFRHAYWNVQIAKKIAKKYDDKSDSVKTGLKWAEKFATAHESESPDGADKSMDLRNNYVGRKIFEENSYVEATNKKKCIGWGRAKYCWNTTSYSLKTKENYDFICLVKQAVNNGVLVKTTDDINNNPNKIVFLKMK